MNNNVIISALVFMVLSTSICTAQIPVELFVGDKKTSIDLMFFKFFKNEQDENSNVLFFSRARSTMDYAMTTTTNLPSFGLTEAVSYNHPQLRGFAPVAVVQILNRGVYPKAGVQYVHVQKELTLFTWLVSETLSQPDIDYFLLMRYTPSISDNLNLFSQLESINVIPTTEVKNRSFTQRLRLGIQQKYVQYGIGADITATGSASYSITTNIGGFLRYEFR